MAGFGFPNKMVVLMARLHSSVMFSCSWLVSGVTEADDSKIFDVGADRLGRMLSSILESDGDFFASLVDLAFEGRSSEWAC